MKHAHDEKVAKFLYKEFFTRYGVPKELVTDQGAQFTSNLISALMKQYNIRHRKSSPYHPQANGQVEVTNHKFENILTKIAICTIGIGLVYYKKLFGPTEQHGRLL